MFENMTQAFVTGFMSSAFILFLLYFGYELLMTELKSKIREEVRDKIDRHKDIYHDK